MSRGTNWVFVAAIGLGLFLALKPKPSRATPALPQPHTPVAPLPKKPASDVPLIFRPKPVASATPLIFRPVEPVPKPEPLPTVEVRRPITPRAPRPKPQPVPRTRDIIESLNRAKKKMWKIPLEGAPYKQYFDDATLKYHLPENLLARVAWQESRFRPDIISGQTKSHAGAVGIMQIVPRWHPDVDPLDVPQAIEYAAGYLSRLHRQFGSWSKALAAYNWGPGNLGKFLAGKIKTMPTETKNYIRDIQGDVLA